MSVTSFPLLVPAHRFKPFYVFGGVIRLSKRLGMSPGRVTPKRARMLLGGLTQGLDEHLIPRVLQQMQGCHEASRGIEEGRCEVRGGKRIVNRLKNIED